MKVRQDGRIVSVAVIVVVGVNTDGRREVLGMDVGPSEPDLWIDAVRLKGISALKTFASGLERDGTAVRAALTTSWSNGHAEAQISRRKMLKRTLYGRAGFPLLRRRVLLAA